MTTILNRTDRDITRAAALLNDGQLVAFGTETVYGLGADAENPAAIAAIFAAKNRPRFNPLICHFLTPEAAFAEVEAGALAEQLADTFWPGPLTLVLPRRPTCKISRLASAGGPTLAIRVPAHPIAQRLLARFGRPIAAPSANRSGAISPTTAAHVLADLNGRIAAIIDSGPCRVGLESTVLDLSSSPPALLRPGGITVESLQAATDRRWSVVSGRSFAPMRSPGLMRSHYAPGLPLRIDAQSIQPNEAQLAFGQPLQGAILTYQLSATRNLNEAAANLFEGLHWLDTNAPPNNLTGIAAMPIPTTGLGQALNDRLTRAAAPKEV